jgi:hypothetical protein
MLFDILVRCQRDVCARLLHPPRARRRACLPCRAPARAPCARPQLRAAQRFRPDCRLRRVVRTGLGAGRGIRGLLEGAAAAQEAGPGDERRARRARLLRAPCVHAHGPAAARRACRAQPAASRSPRPTGCERRASTHTGWQRRAVTHYVAACAPQADGITEARYVPQTYGDKGMWGASKAPKGDAAW